MHHSRNDSTCQPCGLMHHLWQGWQRSSCRRAHLLRPQPPFERRTLLLNHSYYVPRGGHCDPDYEPPQHVEYETHDFLWFLAGDGVLVIHGPSLASMV